MIPLSVSPTTVGLDDFHPADIFINSSSGTFKVGESITIKCAIFQQISSNDQLYTYLCKNGVGVQMGPIGKKGDYDFIIKNVSELDSGSYSCVYSSKKSPASNVSASGQKIIYVQVTEGLGDFRPADIFINSSSGTFKVGESIMIKCVIFQQISSNEELNMYLCKNGVGVEMGPIGQIGEYVFIIKNISELDSGSYSCVYSSKKYPVANVSASRQKTIHVKVTEGLGDFRPADIFINSSSGTFKVGESITIKCVIFQQISSNEELNMYLCKNGVGVQMGPIGQIGEYVFIIKTVSELDSGSYSCVYSSKKYPVANVSASGQKTIHVKVTGKRCLNYYLY
ncbi:hypothetical protein AMEX_G8088 [Astyanax mexicanus]|uniref:Ig-like domain-containing protein n=1 Tax=Astyanax mexicanus TaxID=7994 RepID=A0A8T2M1D1_ASTMX|nr:hypothetical protein AMEX_G8088 [Astyanax mexicanus]